MKLAFDAESSDPLPPPASGPLPRDCELPYLWSRAIRAIAILEYLGTAEAREVLRVTARGPTGAVPARESAGRPAAPGRAAPAVSASAGLHYLRPRRSTDVVPAESPSTGGRRCTAAPGSGGKDSSSKGIEKGGMRGWTTSSLLVSMPPRIHRKLLRDRRMTGLHFWATGRAVICAWFDVLRCPE